MPSHLESGIQSLGCTGKPPDGVHMMYSGTSDEISGRKSGGECVRGLQQSHTVLLTAVFTLTLTDITQT